MNVRGHHRLWSWGVSGQRARGRRLLRGTAGEHELPLPRAPNCRVNGQPIAAIHSPTPPRGVLEDRLVTITRDTQLYDRYVYDASGNLTEKYDGEGRQLLALEYDSQNRLVRREIIGTDEHEFEYDDRGWVTRAKTHYHDVRFDWTSFHRRLVDKRDGEGVEHRYVGLDLTSTTVLGRWRTEYHLVDRGRAIVVVDPAGGTHRVRRHGRGVFTRDYDNGWSETSQYSPRGFCLTKVAYATDKPDAGWVRRYQYSGEGDLTQVVDTERGVTRHDHDAAHRLVGTTHADGRRDTYRYTKSGSLLEKPGLSEATVGHLNQLRYADGHRFDYGVRQNVSRHTTPDGHVLEHRYDARDQLIAIRWNGQPYFTAKYDAIGRRIEKNVQGRVTTYWWDGDRLAAEQLPDGKVRVYVYPDGFAMVPMLFVEYESLDADPKDGARYYLFCDQRGCPERVVDQAGETVWGAYIEPYGTAHVRVGQGFYQPFRFPGHWYDAELGLHYNRFRYYSPWLGRYLQVDPIGEGGGWNVYAYTPRGLSRVDVRGLNECGDDPPEESGEDRPDAQRRGRAEADTGAADERRRRLQQLQAARRRRIEEDELEAIFQRNRELREAGEFDDLQADDLEFIRDDRQLRRASDPDKRVGGGTPGSSIDEARAMDHAERTGQLDAPVERSVRPGADVRSGVGTDAEQHWSMKGIVSRDPEGSRSRTRKELGALADERRRGGDPHGLLVDVRHAGDPRAERAAMQAAADQENAALVAEGHEPIPVAFIMPDE